MMCHDIFVVRTVPVTRADTPAGTMLMEMVSRKHGCARFNSSPPPLDKMAAILQTIFSDAFS